MKLIIKNGTNCIYTSINKGQLQQFYENNETVILNPILTELEKENLDKGMNFDYINGALVFDFVGFSEKEKEEKTKIIVNEYNKKIDEYNKEYPQEEQKMFPTFLRFAEKIRDGKSSKYIEGRAKKHEISTLEYANLIIAKGEAFEIFYLECKNEMEDKINNL